MNEILIEVQAEIRLNALDAMLDAGEINGDEYDYWLVVIDRWVETEMEKLNEAG